MPSMTGIEMGTPSLTRYLRLPGRALSAFLRCDATVVAAVVERELFPLRGRKRYEYAVRRFLTRRFGEIMERYRDSEYCIWPLPEDQIPCLKAARRMLNQLIKHSHGEFRFMDYEWQPL